ncbi:phosphopentomutase [Lentisphaerota bacterium ZTH]|nr:phosphopentomutase [Lentisphaerota bacterium]WET05633.1 phosphopentomutase [Lentisphaerota bacterium ZTH]
MNNNRVLILLMDSFGIGSSADADKFGDAGADTFGHIVESCTKGQADSELRSGPLSLPNLERKGLYLAAAASRKSQLPGYQPVAGSEIDAAYGYAVETSKGKDTPSGHWEIAGSPVFFDWLYFQKTSEGSCFPQDFMHRFIEEAGLKEGILDDGHASGTEVINRLGDEHRKTLKPIIYTSADSVFQIAAHEESFGLERLYDICKTARRILDEMGMNIGRVIARPFTGDRNGNYRRTGNRHDYSVLPPAKTLLDSIKNSGGNVISIGKIADIFANQGITRQVKATGLENLFDQSLTEFSAAPGGSLVFTNFVDFDSEYGHRRDITGYAGALEYFDSRLPELDSILQENDMVVIAADHGCDPTWKGTDHTREHVPFLFWGKSIDTGFIGERKTFADIGQTIAEFLGIEALAYGTSCLKHNKTGNK